MATLKSFDGYTFSSANYGGNIPYDGARDTWRVNAVVLPRFGGAPSIVGGIPSERLFVVDFTYSGSDDQRLAFDRLIGELDPLNTTPREIVATRYNSVDIDNMAIVTLPAGFDNQGSVNILRVNFVLTSPIWRKTSATTLGSPANIASSGDTATPTIGGYAKVYPVYTLTPTTQRTTFTSTLGWRYRQRVTITNSESRDLVNETKTVDFGDHAALVTATKSLASGNDVRVRIAGKELPRTITNPNTKRTLLSFVVNIPAGQSRTYDIVYGNPSAGSPSTLGDFAQAGIDPSRYSALDLGGSSGTATAGAASTLTDSGKSWTTNRWAGCTVQITGGTGSGQRRRVASNTATALTVTRNWGTNPSTDSTYCVWASGIIGDGGVVSTNGTTTTTTDSSQAWGVNMWKGATLVNVTAGTSATISSNTATVLTHGSVTAATSSDVYYIERRGYHRYYVDQVNHAENWRGGWNQTARYTKPGKTQFGQDGIANAWNRWTRWQNRDRISQKRTTPVDVGGSLIHYFPMLDTNRGVAGGTRYAEQGSGDGVAISSPHGYVAAYFDYSLKNPNAICKFVFAAAEEGGEDWADVVTDTTTYATITDVADQWANLTTYGTPLHLYMGLGPADDVEVFATAVKTDTATVRWLDRLELLVDVTNWSIGALTSEAEGYDVQAVITTTSVPTTDPHDEIHIGGEDHWAFVELNDDLVIRTDPQTTDNLIEIDGVAAPWAAQFVRYEEDADGQLVELVSREFAPLAPGSQTVTVTESDMGEFDLDLSWFEGYWVH